MGRPSRASSPSNLLRGALPLHLGGDLGIVLLEALAQALGHGHGLLDAAGDAAGLAGRQRLGGEVVDAGHEAVVDEVAEQLWDGRKRSVWVRAQAG